MYLCKRIQPIYHHMRTRINKNIGRMAACIAISLLVCVTASAERVRLFTAAEMGNASVTRIAQDDDKYVWIATEFGLLRFDGYHFRKFQSDPDVESSLPCSFVTQLRFCQGQMLLGTIYGMARYDKSHERFERYGFPDNNRPRVSGIVEWKGRIVASTEGYGLLYSQSKSTAMQQLAIDKNQSMFVSAMAVDAQGALWTADHASLLLRYTNDVTTDRAETYDVSAYGQVVEMRRYGDDFYVLCRHALLKFDHKKKLLQELITDNQLIFSCLCCLSNGEMLLGTVGNGVYSLEKPAAKASTQSLARFSLNSDKYVIDKEDVRCIYEDRSGNLWIGCYRRGVFFINRQPSAFNIYDNSRDEAFTNILPTASVAHSSTPALYCQTRRGIQLFDAKAQPMGLIPTPVGMEGLYIDHKNRLWIGTDHDLYLYDKELGKARLIDSFSADMINLIADCPADDAKYRDLLFVSTYGKGLCCYDVRTGSKEQLDMNDPRRAVSDRLSNNWISSLCYVKAKAQRADDGGRLWIGTTHGLCIYDPQSNHFDHHKWQQRLDFYDITALWQLKGGDMVIGTNSGLFRYFARGDSLARFSPRGTDLNSAIVTGLCSDHDGNLWISSSCGMWLYDTSSGSFTAYRQADDVALNMFNNYRSIVCCADGSIAVAVDRHLLTFHPRQMRSRAATDAAPMLTAMMVSGRSVAPVEHLTINHTEGMVRLEFSLMDYANAAAVIYRYRINNGPWNDNAPGDNIVTINQISPGDIQIEVMAGLDGHFGKISSYTITVRPPWHQTWWARMLFIGIAIAVIVLITLAIRDRRRLGALISNVQSLREKFAEALHKTYKVDDSTTAADDEMLMQRIMESVNKHFKDSEYLVDDLCSDVGVSRAVLQRKMKELTGLSPSSFVRNLRLEQAKRLLDERKLTISQVAYECGFSSSPVFSKIFRNYYGISPRTYLEQAEKEN